MHEQVLLCYRYSYKAYLVGMWMKKKIIQKLTLWFIFAKLLTAFTSSMYSEGYIWQVVLAFIQKQLGSTILVGKNEMWLSLYWQYKIFHNEWEVSMAVVGDFL